MGRGGSPERGSLLKKAQKDFELARRYRDAKELVKASLLYNSAIERVLRSLCMRKSSRNLPEEASIAYLTKKADLPESMREELLTLQDEMSDVIEEELEIEHAEEDILPGVEEKREYRTVVDKGTIARRLMSYACANK